MECEPPPTLPLKREGLPPPRHFVPPLLGQEGLPPPRHFVPPLLGQEGKLSTGCGWFFVFRSILWYNCDRDINNPAVSLPRKR